MTDIHEILRQYPPDCQSTGIEALGSAGGMSGAQFWRLAAPGGPLVLRRWPREYPPPDRLRFIHAVLRHAAQRGISFVPVPIATRNGQSFVEHSGYLWELAPWLRGTADYNRAPSLEKLRAALAALAEFHNATVDFDSTSHAQFERTPATTRHVSRLEQLAPSGIAELSRAISDSAWPELAPLARQFVAALPRALPRAVAQLEPLANVSFPLQPCIRDIWHDHVLFAGNEVAGLIDFGAIDFDTPATDISRLLGSFASATVPFLRETATNTALDFGLNDSDAAKRGLSPSNPYEAKSWSEGVAAYSAVRPLSPHESLAAHALANSGAILAGCNWIRWLYVENRQFENRVEVITRFRRLLSTLDR